MNQSSQTSVLCLKNTLWVLCPTKNKYDGITHFSKLGAQTIARFLQCIPVRDPWEAMFDKCFIKNAAVLRKQKTNKLRTGPSENGQQLVSHKQNTQK